jgi:DNA-binding MarR family transcriptional regulator
MKMLDEFLSEVVMTGYYLAEPPRVSTKYLHDAEMKCLKIIHKFGPIKTTQISELMFTTKSRATQLTQVLEKYGYISHVSGSDKRTKVLSITSEGEVVINDVKKKYRQLSNTIEVRLGKQKTLELCAILQEITPLTKLLSKKGNIK